MQVGKTVICIIYPSGNGRQLWSASKKIVQIVRVLKNSAEKKLYSEKDPKMKVKARESLISSERIVREISLVGLSVRTNSSKFELHWLREITAQKSPQTYSRRLPIRG